MAEMTLKFGDITPPDTWDVDEDCLDFSSANEICLGQLFLSRVEFRVGRDDISPSITVPLLRLVLELLDGIEQAKKYSPGGRGCVFTPICEYELTFENGQVHIFWFTWESVWKYESNNFRGEFVVDERDSMNVFGSFIKSALERLKTDYGQLAMNPLFGALGTRASKAFMTNS